MSSWFLYEKSTGICCGSKIEYKPDYDPQVDITPWKHVKLASCVIFILGTATYLLFSAWGVADEQKRILDICQDPLLLKPPFFL